MSGEPEMHPIPAIAALLESGASLGIEVKAGTGYEADRVTIVAILRPEVSGKQVPITIEAEGTEIEATAEEVRTRMVRALTALDPLRVAGTPVRAV